MTEAKWPFPWQRGTNKYDSYCVHCNGKARVYDGHIIGYDHNQYCEIQRAGDLAIVKEPIPKRVYIICPVRNVTPYQKETMDDYVQYLESCGVEVHYPPRDVDQNDETGGYAICCSHMLAMREAVEVRVFYDESSGGSKFDLGMAFAMHKPVSLVRSFTEDTSEKSFLKVIKAIEEKWRTK